MSKGSKAPSGKKQVDQNGSFIRKGSSGQDGFSQGWNEGFSRKPAKGVIFDGFPRTIPQAKALKKMLNERGTDVSVMLNLQVEEEELIKRLLERGKVSGRSDDNLETIKSRLDVYHTQTAPLADYYVGEGKHVAIKGMGTIEEIFGRIKEAVNNVK